MRKACGVAVPIDTTQALLRPSQLEALVRAVHVADEHDEHDWIEWKNTLDFTTADDKWHVAKQILGFSNRTVATAQRHTGGYAYLLVGVEPGALTGVTSIDNADLTSAIERYVGTARWSLEQVQVDGKKVVILIVEPPKPGDDPFTLRKAYRNFPEGAIFVRSPGRTEQASTVQVQALMERAKAMRETLDIGIRAEPATIEFGPSLDDNRIDELLVEERSVLMAPNRSRRPAPHSQGYSELAGAGYSSIMSALSGLQAFARERRDERSETDYAQEVETYLDELREAVKVHHLHERYNRPAASLRLVVDNPTDRNFRGLHVVVHVEGDVRRWEEDIVDELYRAEELPDTSPAAGHANEGAGAVHHVADPYGRLAQGNPRPLIRQPRPGLLD